MLSKKIDAIKDVEFVECGGNFVLCKCINNDVFAWGSNEHGQFGTGDRNRKNSPVKCSNWPKSVLDNLVDIKCGTYFTFVLTSNQEVYSCGDNEYCQLGRKAEGYLYDNLDNEFYYQVTY